MCHCLGEISRSRISVIATIETRIGGIAMVSGNLIKTRIFFVLIKQFYFLNST